MKTIKYGALLLLLPMLFAQSGCEKQAESNSSSAISFKSFVGRPIRGSDLNQLSSTSFGLFAYQGSAGMANGVDNYAVAANAELLNGGAAYADATDKIYWPNNSDKLGFYAYAPYSDGSTNGISNISPTVKGEGVLTPPSFSFEVNGDVRNQVDLLVSTIEKQSTLTSVALTFRHALTKVVIQASTSVPNWRVAITKVELKNIAYKGDYIFVVSGIETRKEGWQTDTSLTTSYNVPLNINGAATPNGAVRDAVVVDSPNVYVPVVESGESMFLMPQILSRNARLEVTYNIYNSSSNTIIFNTELLSIDIANVVGMPSGFRSDLINGFITSYFLQFNERTTGGGSLISFDTSVEGWRY